MLRKVNAQGLMDLIRANEEAPGFNLDSWFHPCGTYGCLAGNYLLDLYKRRGESLAFRAVDYEFLADEFHTTVAESVFLFSPWNFKYSPGFGMHLDDTGPDQDMANPRPCADREQSLRRVRKFLYYKLRKRELLYEEDGRVRESARKEEGDKHVCRDVLALV